MNGVPGQPVESLDHAIGPPDSDWWHARPAAETEVDPHVVVREIAAAAAHIRDLRRPVSFQPDARADDLSA